MGDYLMSLIKANNITNTTGGIPTVKSQQLIPTAWVNFNGTGTVAIRDSEGVSSITDSGTGDYRVTFTSAMANTNYATILGGNRNNANGSFIISGSENVNYVQIKTWNIATTATDWLAPCVAIMGGQA